MEIQPRVVIVASFGLGSLLLAAGCGSESTGSSATLANIQGSSYVTIQPATTTTTIVVPTTVQAGTSADAQTYTVVSGDSVSKIARKYDITVDELANANLTNPVYNTFLIGSTLNIPPNGDCG